jgi:hypothetical protein
MQFVRTTAIGLAFAACATAAATGNLAATPAPAQLTALAFPGWSDGPAGRIVTVTLPAGSAAYRGYAGWNPGANRVLVEPRLVLRLDATHLTLVAGLVPASDDGRPAAAHLTPMALAAYQFELSEGAWTLARRQGVFGLRGFFGEATLRAVALSSQRQAVAVEYGSCWEGYCGTWLALYEVDNGMVRHEPAVELTLSGHDENAAADCARRLQPLVKPHNQDIALRDDGTPPEGHDCYVIDGSWSVEPTHGARDEPGDLVLHYQGAMSRGEAHTLGPSAIDQRQVLRYGSGKYRAVSGFNPVPPI